MKYEKEQIIQILKDSNFLETLEAIIESHNEKEKTGRWDGHGIIIRSKENGTFFINSIKNDYSEPYLAINIELGGRGIGELKERKFNLHNSMPVSEVKKLIEEWEKKHPQSISLKIN